MQRKEARDGVHAVVPGASPGARAGRGEGHAPAMRIGHVESFDNGVEVFQVTAESVPTCNIYCEFPWCSPDSRWFVYSRLVEPGAANPLEYVACEAGNWETRVIGRSTGHPAMVSGRFCFRRTADRGRAEWVMVDLGRWTEEAVSLPADILPASRIDMSADGRYLAYNRPVSFASQRFAIRLLDLRTGDVATLHEDPWICNPHHQFEPSEGRLLMVQHNRGCRYLADGRMEVLCGPEGCTLFLLTVPDGRVIRLPVGPPSTPSLSGHETWIGGTRELIATLNLTEDYHFGKGPIVGITPEGRVRPICDPWQMNHIGMEPSGRVFCADAFEPDVILLGSPRTDRAVVVCPARTSYRRGAVDAHPHAYILPDLRHVIFNSDRTGSVQVYAARLPRSLVEAVLPP